MPSDKIRHVKNWTMVGLLLLSAITAPVTAAAVLGDVKGADENDAKGGDQVDGQQEPVTGFEDMFEYEESTDYIMAPEKCVCPCKAEPTKDYIDGKWVQVANTKVSGEILESTALNTPIEDGGAELRGFETGSGTVRTDFYAVTVCLAADKDPKEYLAEIMNNPNAIGNGEDFTYWAGWPAAGESGRKQGDVIDLDIRGPDNGAIIYLDVDLSDGEFCVMTVENDASGTHPISGTRCFGYEEMGAKEVMFYTVGIESATIRGTGDAGAKMQDSMWKAMMKSIASDVVEDGGKVCKLFADDEWHSQSDLLKKLRKQGYTIKSSSLDPTVEVDEKYDLGVTIGIR